MDSVFWKEVNIPLEIKDDKYELLEIRYNPEREYCQHCAKKAKFIFIGRNKEADVLIQLDPTCASQYINKEYIEEALLLLRKKIFPEKFNKYYTLIKQYKYTTQSMRTFLYAVENGNYPWRKLLSDLRNELLLYTPNTYKKVIQFIECYKTTWIAKELQKFLDKGEFPTSWYLKEMEKVKKKKGENHGKIS